jgi:hypothetical protein
VQRIKKTGTVHMNEIKDEKELGINRKKHNVYCEIGFFLGVFSIFYSGFIAVPLLAVTFSIIGITTFRNSKHKDKWKAYWGILLGTLLALASFV